MQLYTIHYSLQHVVSKFDAKGKKISEEMTLIEQTLTALPHSTAMQYKDLPNFSIAPYVAEQRDRSNFKHSGYSARRPEPAARSKPKAAKKTPKSGLHHAAATGDLGAAISGAK